jgi:hypothetical protein
VHRLQVAELGEQLEPLRVRRGCVDVPFVGLRQIVPALCHLVQRFQRTKGLAIGTELVEQGLIGVRSLRYRVEPLPECLSGTHQERAAQLFIAGDVAPLRHDFHQLAKPLGLFVEPVERGERRRVVRVLVRTLPPGGDGPVIVQQLALAELTQPTQELATSEGVLLERDLNPNDLGELLVVARRDVETLERAGRWQGQGGVIAIEVEHLAVHSLGLQTVAHQLFVDAGDVHQNLTA